MGIKNLSKRRNKVSKRRSNVSKRKSRLIKYGGMTPGETLNTGTGELNPEPVRSNPVPEAVQKRVNFGKVYDDDDESHDLYECPPPKEYAILQGMGNKQGPDFRKKAFKIARHSSTTAVKAGICGSDTPFLTDNGYCCSATDE